MKHSLTAAMALLLAAVTNAQEPRVLFIGNSYTEVNNLPQMVYNVAQSMGESISYTSNTPGGCTFQQHCINRSMELICQGGWDVVVLQEQSQYPSFPQSQVENEVFPYAEQLIDSVYAYNPCAEPMFYMTWGRKNGDQRNAQYFPVLGTYEGMDSMLCERYTYMAAAYDAALCPVGRVWRYIRTNNPEIELYQSDESHPSVAGTYAAACAFYTLFFHNDPSNIRYNAGLDENVAQYIRNAVRTIVYDSLYQWQRPQPSLDSIEYQLDGNNVLYTFQVGNADSLTWHFGDGTDTITSSDVTTVTHSFQETGTYITTICASRHCMTVCDSIVVQASTNDSRGLQTCGDEPIVIFPNPTTDNATIQINEPSVVTLTATNGHRLWCLKATEGRMDITLKDFPHGIYLITVTTSRGTSTKSIIKTR